MHIVFVAYNRPQYFKQCIDSIKGQITDERVSLVLEGPYVDPKVKESEQIFIDAFGKDNIYPSEYNLGPDLNLIRSFEIGFNTCDDAHMMMVEDDLWFHPLCLKQMKILEEFCESDDDIVSHSCFTRETLNIDDGVYNMYYNRLINQHNHCASAVKRKYWDEILRLCFEEYRRVYCVRYNYEDIYNYLVEKYNIYRDCYSMDAYYASILAYYKKYRVSTTPNFVRHIGMHGTNHDEISYGWREWDKIRVGNILVENPYLDKNYKGFMVEFINFQGKDWKENVQNYYNQQYISGNI